MAEKTFITLDPTATAAPRAFEPAARPATLAGKRVGLFSNGKPNSTALLDHLAVLLRQQHGVGEIVRAGKPRSSVVAEPSVLDDLARRVDVFVTAIGD